MTARAGRLTAWSVATGGLVVALLCAARIDQPFLDGHLGYAGALRGVIGQSYLRHDPVAIRFAPLQNAGPTRDGPPSVRYNHPPLSAMLVGLAFRLTGGASEAAARVVPLVASVATVPLLFFFVRRLWGEAVAVVAVALWSLSPFVAIWGAMPSYEPLVLCAWWGLLAAWASWLQERRRRSLVAAAVAAALGVWTDWPMVVLAGGLLAVEAIGVRLRSPRRPAFLVTLGLAVALALGALALYYLVVLDVDRAGLERLYAARSSIGRWELGDVVAHIGLRTGWLLGWPVVVAGAAGVLLNAMGRDRRDTGPEERAPRTVLALGLVAPALGLLLLLPQHAVIHCFSAWYLLPGAAVGAALGLVTVGRSVARRWGRPAVVALALIFGGLQLWGAVPVVLDGWVSDGSPFEARPRLEYRHLAVARWVRDMTGPDDVLLIDAATGVVGVRAWFQHDRAVRRVGRRERLDRALGALRGRVALVSRARLPDAALRRLAARHPTTVLDDVVVIDGRRERSAVRVLELHEERPSLWWRLARSATVPPHRWVEAPARAAWLERAVLGRSTAAGLPALGDDASLAEVAARQRLSEVTARRRAARQAAERLDLRADASLGEGVEWLGVEIEPGVTGRPTFGLLLRAAEPVAGLPRIDVSLRGAGRRPSWRPIAADDAGAFAPGDLVAATWRLAEVPRPGRYRLELRRGPRTVRSAPFELDSRPPLPVMSKIGRIW